MLNFEKQSVFLEHTYRPAEGRNTM